MALVTLLSMPTVLAQYCPFANNPLQNVPIYIVPTNYISYTTGQPTFLCNELMKDFAIIPDVCYTNVTLPLSHKTYYAGEKIYIQGRVYTSTIGYGVVNPQVHLYFDGTYVGTAYGDVNGNYYFTFTVPSYCYSGFHSISANATLQGCEAGYVHDRVYIDAYEPTVPPYIYTVSNLGSLVFNVKDCDTGKYIPAYAVLSPGLYSRSSTTGTITFSEITARSYDYRVSAGGYSTESGSVDVVPDNAVTEDVCLKKMYPLPAPPQSIEVPTQVDPPVPTFASTQRLESQSREESDRYYLFTLSPILFVLVLIGVAINLYGRYKIFRTPEMTCV